MQYKKSVTMLIVTLSVGFSDLGFPPRCRSLAVLTLSVGYSDPGLPYPLPELGWSIIWPF